MSGTFWNDISEVYHVAPYMRPSGGGVINYPTDFTTSEASRITQIWQRMAGDFAPFNVDVTTEKPASFGSRTGTVTFTEQRDVFNTPLYCACRYVFEMLSKTSSSQIETFSCGESLRFKSHQNLIHSIIFVEVCIVTFIFGHRPECCGIGGVAYVNVWGRFNFQRYQPAWVHAGNLVRTVPVCLVASTGNAIRTVPLCEPKQRGDV